MLSLVIMITGFSTSATYNAYVNVAVPDPFVSLALYVTKYEPYLDNSTWYDFANETSSNSIPSMLVIIFPTWSLTVTEVTTSGSSTSNAKALKIVAISLYLYVDLYAPFNRYKRSHKIRIITR